MQQAKIIILSLIMVLITATVVLQMAVFGNDEEMEELEYEEFQIKIDFEKMTNSLIHLFDGSAKYTKSRSQAEDAQDAQTDAAEANLAPALQNAPTVPTVPTVKPFGKE